MKFVQNVQLHHQSISDAIEVNFNFNLTSHHIVETEAVP